MTTMPIALDSIRLAQGSHGNGPPPGADGCEMCLFEWYNWLACAAEQRADCEISDDCPPDVSRVLHAVGMRLNDLLPDDTRQQLARFLPTPDRPSPLAGTAGDGLDDTRRLMAVDWSLRTATPMWMDTAGQPEWAATLRALPPITDWAAYDAALPVIRDIRAKARALREERYAELRAKYRSAAAVAAVVAAAAAADADAAAVVAVAAAADADADAAAVVAAVAAVAVAAAADADADAAAAGRYSETYEAVYNRVKPLIEERYAPTITAVHASAIDLYGRMIHPTSGGR